MAFFNPIQIIATLFLALVALPLAFFACVTTWLACWILVTRLLFVYAELAWEMARYALWDRWRPGQYIDSPSVSARSSRPASPTMTMASASCSAPFSTSSPPVPRSPEFSSLKGASRSRRRTGSISSTGSGASAGVGVTAGGVGVGGGGGGGGIGPRVAFSGASLLEAGPNAWERDFEGLGGWRIQQANGNDDAADENAWSSLNSRLELPPEHQHQHHQRHHSRAHTHAGSFSNNYTMVQPPRSGARSGPHSPERLLIPRSPGSRTPSRVRVGPLTNLERNDSYFPLLASASIKNVVA